MADGITPEALQTRVFRRSSELQQDLAGTATSATGSEAAGHCFTVRRTCPQTSAASTQRAGSV